MNPVLESLWMSSLLALAPTAFGLFATAMAASSWKQFCCMAAGMYGVFLALFFLLAEFG